MCHTSADYVEDVYQAFLVAEQREQLADAMQELHDMNPPPMNTMLEKQSREDAVQKRTERKGMTVQDVPPTTPGNVHILKYAIQRHKVCHFHSTFMYPNITDTVWLQKEPHYLKIICKAYYTTLVLFQFQ